MPNVACVIPSWLREREKKRSNWRKEKVGVGHQTDPRSTDVILNGSHIRWRKEFHYLHPDPCLMETRTYWEFKSRTRFQK
jgi:hypothetical protein